MLMSNIQEKKKKKKTQKAKGVQKGRRRERERGSLLRAVSGGADIVGDMDPTFPRESLGVGVCSSASDCSRCLFHAAACSLTVRCGLSYFIQSPHARATCAWQCTPRPKVGDTGRQGADHLPA